MVLLWPTSNLRCDDVDNEVITSRGERRERDVDLVIVRRDVEVDLAGRDVEVDLLDRDGDEEEVDTIKLDRRRRSIVLVFPRE